MDDLGEQARKLEHVGRELMRRKEELIEALAQDCPYGLHATIWGWRDAPRVVSALAWENYLTEVPSLIFGKFGMMTINAAIPPAEKSLRRKGAARPLGIGGFGYSGWIWETFGGKFVLKQGPKGFDIESSLPIA